MNFYYFYNERGRTFQKEIEEGSCNAGLYQVLLLLVAPTGKVWYTFFDFTGKQIKRDGYKRESIWKYYITAREAKGSR